MNQAYWRTGLLLSRSQCHWSLGDRTPVLPDGNHPAAATAICQAKVLVSVAEIPGDHIFIRLRYSLRLEAQRDQTFEATINPSRSNHHLQAMATHQCTLCLRDGTIHTSNSDANMKVHLGSRKHGLGEYICQVAGCPKVTYRMYVYNEDGPLLI